MKNSHTQGKAPSEELALRNSLIHRLLDGIFYYWCIISTHNVEAEKLPQSVFALRIESERKSRVHEVRTDSSSADSTLAEAFSRKRKFSSFSISSPRLGLVPSISAHGSRPFVRERFKSLSDLRFEFSIVTSA